MIKKNIVSFGLLILAFLLCFSPLLVSAQEMPTVEVRSLDSDNDGYSDVLEIEKGYSPFNPEPIKIEKSDMDKDGLSDYFELKFKTDSFVADTDQDGYSDFEEIDRGFNPLSSSTVKLVQKIEIILSSQKLFYYVGDQKWKEFVVSTGKKSTPTPTGNFKVANKNKKAWSKTYGLWMPFWLGLDRGGIGIHELPVWPNGYREGEDHLGKPVSHGCIRLGIGSAQYVFDRINAGTQVLIVK
ncbi:MAG: L,D-transpeptidase family protein [Patescibacteria group bacterium]